MQVASRVRRALRRLHARARDPLRGPPRRGAARARWASTCFVYDSDTQDKTGPEPPRLVDLARRAGRPVPLGAGRARGLHVRPAAARAAEAAGHPARGRAQRSSRRSRSRRPRATTSASRAARVPGARPDPRPPAALRRRRAGAPAGRRARAPSHVFATDGGGRVLGSPRGAGGPRPARRPRPRAAASATPGASGRARGRGGRHRQRDRPGRALTGGRARPPPAGAHGGPG